MNCRQVQALVETFVDGELSPEQTLEVEIHLTGCEVCAEHLRFAHAVKTSTRHAVLADTEVSGSFRGRLEQALAAEAQRELSEEDEQRAARRVLPFSWRAVSWRGVAPALATAAAFVLWIASRNAPEGSNIAGINTGADAPQQAAAAVLPSELNLEQTLDRLIDYHSSPPQPQVTQPELLQALEPNVGVRVRLPTEFERFGAQWEGANLVSVRNYQAASLRYRIPGQHIPGHRVTIYVYDARKVPVHRTLQRHLILDDPIYLGEWRGYKVAAKQDHGVGYALATDLDDAQIAELIRAIH